MVFLVGLACYVSMDPSAATIVQYTAHAQYIKVPVTSWMNLFSSLPRGVEESSSSEYCTFAPYFDLMCGCSWSCVFMHYVGIVSVLLQHRLAWIREPRFFCSPSLKPCPGIFSLPNPMIWCSVPLVILLSAYCVPLQHTSLQSRRRIEWKIWVANNVSNSRGWGCSTCILFHLGVF